MLNSLLGVLSDGVPPVTGSFESIVTLNGTGSSGIITFSSIPQTYTHLQIRGIARDVGSLSAASNVSVNYNGITTSTYFNHRLIGDGTSASAAGNASNGGIGAAIISAGNSMTANAYAVFILDILDYTSTTKTKTLTSFTGINTNSGSTNNFVRLSSGSSTATTAITSISFTNATNNFDTTTSFALYGIKG